MTPPGTDFKEYLEKGACWVAEREPLVLLLLAPWLLFPTLSTALTVAALILLPLFWLSRVVAGRPLAVRSPLNLPLLLLLACMVPAVRFSPLPVVSARWATPFLFGASIYFAIVNCEPRWRQLEHAAMGFTIAGGLTALVALLSTNWVEGKIEFLDRVTRGLPAPFVEPGGGLAPEQVAGLIALMLPVVMSFARLSRRRGREPMMGHWQVWTTVSVLVILMMTVVLILTQVRAALVVTLVIAGIVIGVRRRLVWVLVLALLVTAGILVLIAVLTGSVSDWMMRLDSFGLPVGQQPTAWLEISEIWVNALAMMRDYPLYGSGLALFPQVAWLNTRFGIVGPERALHHASNLWLQAGVDFGVLGLAAFCLLCAIVLLMGWAIQRRRQPDDRILLAGLWLGVLAWLGHGVFHAISLWSRPALAVWVMFGLLASSWTQGWREEPRLATGRRRLIWQGVAAAGAVTLVLFLLGQTTFWVANRGANILDQALLADENTLLPEALDYLEEAAELSGVTQRRALASYEMGQREQAIALFRRVDQVDDYLVSQGRWRLYAGDEDVARDWVLMGLAVAPDSGPLACLAGDVYRSAGKLYEAGQYLRQVPAASETFGDDDRQLARCLYSLAELDGALGGWSNAAEWLSRAVALQPTVVRYQIEYGKALFRATGEPGEAAAVEEAALALDPESTEILMVLAEMYLKAGRSQQGFEWAQKAVTAAPVDPAAWLLQATALVRLDRLEEARASLAEVLRLDPENAAALALQTQLESP